MGTIAHDFVVNRYYSNAYGRFMTPDPYQGSSGGAGDPNNPQSWNRYAYVVGDPVNAFDPEGLDGCSPNNPTPCFSVTGTASPTASGFVGVPGGGGDGQSNQTAQEKGQHAGPPSSSPTPAELLALALAAAKAQVAADLAKPGCAKDFKNASKDIAKVNQVGMSNQGTLQYSTDPDGNIVPAQGTPGVARYNSFTGSINLNSQVNWLDPSQTSSLLNGSAYTANLLAGQAAALGVSSITAAQYMDLTILHELSHYNGAIGNPDTNPTVEMNLWNDCIK